MSELDALIENLSRLSVALTVIGKRNIAIIVNDLAGRLAQYPPATDANRPGRTRETLSKRADAQGRRRVYLRPQGYYVRNEGWYYPVMRRENLPAKMLVSAGVRKAPARVRKIFGVQGYKLSRGGTSEHLGRSWTADVIVSDGLVTGRIGNKASYWPMVQGERQIPFHQARGWKTVEENVRGIPFDEIAGQMADEIAQAIIGGVHGAK